MAARGSPDMFLWDPYTGTRISLPPDREGFLMGDGHWRCLLSRKPVVAAAHPNCTVDVLVLSLEGTAFWHCRLGRDERWLRHEYDHDQLPLSTPSTLNGMFVIMFVNKVVMLELSTEPVMFTEIPVDMDPASTPPCTYSMSRLVESRGDLFRVTFLLSDLQRRIIDGISVFKLDLSARVWEKVELLDGRVFLVQYPSQFWRIA
ncbi:hypothetical protein C2845_PM03G33110 [Panicum miliaceum]|uniref:KIB1-4 beta-propeller domain-containing protein n=1 Tax=Panicum miliaceum TaxID=4540 RepID=A0A3L6T6E3_PANMI|nr:hypothetical protein C2845_PM03G33110 [Panicum miliaceum]